MSKKTVRNKYPGEKNVHEKKIRKKYEKKFPREKISNKLKEKKIKKNVRKKFPGEKNTKKMSKRKNFRKFF